MLLNLFDYERAAAARVAEPALGYLTGGANDEVTMRANREAFDAIAIRYRTMVDVSVRDTQTTVLGTRVAFPALIAPTAMQRLAHPDGECAMARAAERLGVVMIVSTTATTGLVEVCAATPAPKWFQCYIYRDRGVTRALLEQARAAGYQAVVLTVDAPRLGRRERDVRQAFNLPPGMRLPNAELAGEGELHALAGDSSLSQHLARTHDAALTPTDVRWIHEVTGLPVIVKGIVRGDDAKRALDHGAAGVAVSNHGGRQLDTAIAAIRALPEVVVAVAERGEVYVDGGVRRGTDIVKAIALGARAVLLGRPALWGLAVNGEQGVVDALTILRDEFDLAMALCGCRSVSEITGDLIA
ncbi:MAG TPA: alpha-hydroxy acid oxidase [Gemmatimonadaceae bacterium]|nr:alpha-hydroxy acid oxidase [Gemmatimonadaceae bacterium]